MHVLIVEDDRTVAEYVARGLKDAGHQYEYADNGKDGHYQATTAEFDVMIIDRMLPHMDGLSIIKAIRDRDIRTPVLILSALGEVDDRVKGLQAGGDDYLVKPFAVEELLARVEALHRRKENLSTKTRMQVADLEVDMLSHKVIRGGKKFNLQPREYKLLEYLMKHAGQIVTRTMLLENVWDYHFDPQTNVIDVHISRLRQQIDKDFDKQLLCTIRGVGYTLQDPDDPNAVKNDNE